MRIARGLRSRIAERRVLLGFAPVTTTVLRGLLVAATACACAGCGHDLVEADPEPVKSRPRVAIAQPALLKAQAVPNCEYRGAANDLKDDAAEATRVKLDYERQCYKHAEMIARMRLAKLQAAVKRAAAETEYASAAPRRMER